MARCSKIFPCPMLSFSVVPLCRCRLKQRVAASVDRTQNSIVQSGVHTQPVGVVAYLPLLILCVDDLTGKCDYKWKDYDMARCTAPVGLGQP